MIEVRWHGRGGQGGFTAARLLGLAAALFEGRHALAFPSFGPERRGAPVFGFTRIDDRKITDRSAVTACDFVVVIDETLAGPRIADGLRPAGKLILNTAEPQKYAAVAAGHEIVALDATALARRILGRPIANTAMLGALLAATGIVRLDSAEKGIAHELKPKIAQKNIELLRESFAAVAGRVAA
jgi:pyruvate ferredoxin oxidoreductase gamma subunit